MVPMAGVYIDGELKAFTVGSLNEQGNMAVTILKRLIRRSTVCTVYQSAVLVHEFPDVALVNREDDVGMPGLQQGEDELLSGGFCKKIFG